MPYRASVDRERDGDVREREHARADTSSPSLRDRSVAAPASTMRSTTSRVSGPALAMSVVLNRRGGAGRRRSRAPSTLARSSGLTFALRFTSNSTSSLPFAGSWAYSAVTIARVLTVKSTTDWKVRTGGSPASRSSRA